MLSTFISHAMLLISSFRSLGLFIKHRQILIFISRRHFSSHEQEFLHLPAEDVCNVAKLVSDVVKSFHFAVDVDIRKAPQLLAMSIPSFIV